MILSQWDIAKREYVKELSTWQTLLVAYLVKLTLQKIGG